MTEHAVAIAIVMAVDSSTETMDDIWWFTTMLPKKMLDDYSCNYLPPGCRRGAKPRATVNQYSTNLLMTKKLHTSLHKIPHTFSFISHAINFQLQIINIIQAEVFINESALKSIMRSTVVITRASNQFHRPVHMSRVRYQISNRELLVLSKRYIVKGTYMYCCVHYVFFFIKMNLSLLHHMMDGIFLLPIRWNIRISQYTPKYPVFFRYMYKIYMVIGNQSQSKILRSGVGRNRFSIVLIYSHNCIVC